MATDWNKEGQLIKRIWRWWFVTGLLCIPFGFIYGEARRALGYDNKLVMVVCAVACLACNYVIQGFPPNE